eukprot:TRINITY_DN12533_c0_g1_i1.p1 TRINITY_DN12533_c0_g1~~TRINITY_DN12533_c0_g1_i1.p1  ORF type:complete len:305 (+),score=84.28 TRINITY_DN12533_c0_g1_i1:39-953(+)
MSLKETVRDGAVALIPYQEGSGGDEEIALIWINDLKNMEVTVSLLKETNLGRIITKIVSNKNNSKKLRRSAASLRKLWKQKFAATNVSPEESRKRKRTPEEKPNKARKTKVNSTPTETEDQEEQTEQPTAHNESQEEFKGNTDNGKRNKVQTLLYKALGQCNIPGVSITSAILAENIENALLEKYPDAGKEYFSKFRTLHFNLKDPLNQGLRDTLYMGNIPIDRFVDMSPDELANPELQEKRKQVKDWHTQARMGVKEEASCTSFYCGKCKQNKTTYFQLQTRSADEPMTTFVTCVNCGNHWRF